MYTLTHTHARRVYTVGVVRQRVRTSLYIPGLCVVIIIIIILVMIIIIIIKPCVCTDNGRGAHRRRRNDDERVGRGAA